MQSSKESKNSKPVRPIEPVWEPRQPLTPEETEQFKARWRARFGREPQEHDLLAEVSLHQDMQHIKWLHGEGRPLKDSVEPNSPDSSEPSSAGLTTAETKSE